MEEAGRRHDGPVRWYAGRTLPALALALLLAACSDVAETGRAPRAAEAARPRPAAPGVGDAADAPAARPAVAGVPAVPAPLPQLPDPALSIRPRAYADAATAAALEGPSGNAAIRVFVRGPDIEAVEEAIGIVWGMMASRDLQRDSPVLVTGVDLRAAAMVADRLVDAGLQRVFVVLR